MIICIAEAGYCAGWTSAAGRGSQPCPRIVAARCQQKIREPVTDTVTNPELPQTCSHPALRSIAAVALVAVAAGATAPPCNAGRGGWLPRRHWRRMDDPRQRSVEMYMPAKVHHPAPWLSGTISRCRGSVRWCLTRIHRAAGEAAQCAEAGGVFGVHGEQRCRPVSPCTPLCRLGFPGPIPTALQQHSTCRGSLPIQVGHLVEEARSKATSIQQSVSKALTGKSEEGFTMGMRSPAPSYAPQPAWVQFLKSGESFHCPDPPGNL